MLSIPGVHQSKIELMRWSRGSSAKSNRFSGPDPPKKLDGDNSGGLVNSVGRDDLRCPVPENQAEIPEERHDRELSRDVSTAHWLQ